VTIEWRADSRSEDETVIFPENSGQQSLLGLAGAVLTKLASYLGNLVGATGFEPVTPRL
jgi:hypothetical protein